MIDNSGQLLLDTKIQDKFREMLATGILPGLAGVVLGDSDIDYNNPNILNSRVMNTPFSSNKIKYPLIYSGSENGLDGYITCFSRMIEEGLGDGGFILPVEPATVNSYYNYPPDTTLISGNTPPNLNNGINLNNLFFGASSFVRHKGYILFFQTLLLNYFDTSTNLLKRFNEPMTFEIHSSSSLSLINNAFEITIDEGTTPIIFEGRTINVYHNSLLISKSTTIASNLDFTITATGQISNIKKIINIHSNNDVDL